LTPAPWRERIVTVALPDPEPSRSEPGADLVMADACGALAAVVAARAGFPELTATLLACSASVLNADSSVLLVVDGPTRMTVCTASDPDAAALGDVAAQGAATPVSAVVRSRRAMGTAVADLRGACPEFAHSATSRDFESVCALPVRDGARVVAVAMLLRRNGAFHGNQIHLAQGLVDVAAATLTLAGERDVAQTRADQLQTALTSRIAIEQAKGVVAALSGVDPDEAFRALRRCARDANSNLHELARRIVCAPRGADARAVARRAVSVAVGVTSVRANTEPARSPRDSSSSRPDPDLRNAG
jgi:hypothetical protein